MSNSRLCASSGGQDNLGGDGRGGGGGRGNGGSDNDWDSDQNDDANMFLMGNTAGGIIGAMHKLMGNVRLPWDKVTNLLL